MPEGLCGCAWSGRACRFRRTRSRSVFCVAGVFVAPRLPVAAPKLRARLSGKRHRRRAGGERLPVPAPPPADSLQNRTSKGNDGCAPNQAPAESHSRGLPKTDSRGNGLRAGAFGGILFRSGCLLFRNRRGIKRAHGWRRRPHEIVGNFWGVLPIAKRGPPDQFPTLDSLLTRPFFHPLGRGLGLPGHAPRRRECPRASAPRSAAAPTDIRASSEIGLWLYIRDSPGA